MGGFSIASWLWVIYFGAAYLLLVRRAGHWAVLLGLLGLGCTNLAYRLPQWNPEFGELFVEIRNGVPWLFAVSVLLLVFGVISMSLRQAAARPAAQAASAADLTTLLVPRTTTNTYTRAVALRDELARRFAAQAQAAGLRTVEQKSNAHSAQVWLALHYLLPQPDAALSLRASVEVTVRRLDFHRFEHLFDVTARLGASVRQVQGVIALDDDAVARIQNFVTTPGERLRLSNRVRTWPWEFWHKANKVARIRPDWVVAGMTAAAVLAMLIPVAGVLIAAGLFVAIFLRNRRRSVYTLTGGRPLTDPRELRWMDSWQATVAGLASATARMTEGVVNRIRIGAPADLGVGVERFGYWSVDGQVERDQLAVRYRRALGFVHVVPYGDHLYVGWESHLNAAAWAEETMARGVDRVSGCNVHANRVVYGVQTLNEYDIADANFLSEWLHAAVKRELQIQAADHKIDLEIDFTVQRESRKSALGAGTGATVPKPEARGLFAGRFKRVT